MVPGKHLVNNVDNAVEESLSGHVLAYPHLTLHASKKVVLAPNWNVKRNKVAIICGGGSGHEPFVSGFVGSGMLTASVAGSIYAAPPPSNILHAIQCVKQNNEAGCFVIIPNYTGDCLNFGIAIEKAKCLNIEVGQIIVGEDCSIPEKEEGRAGKRGLCGIIFVIKIVGALAENEKSLSEITKYAQLVVSNMATYGVGLKACSIPGKGLMFELPSDEIEFGLGIHGEAGYIRTKLQSVNEIICHVIDQIMNNLNLTAGSSVAVLINNFGALSQLEQGIVTYETVTQLENKKIKVERTYAGLLMTSLDGTGFHVTILRLPESEKRALLMCLDERTDAPRWPGCLYSTQPVKGKTILDVEEKGAQIDTSDMIHNSYKISEAGELLLKRCIENASQAIIKQETFINELDTGCGDGDCGSTLRRLAEAINSSKSTLCFAYPCILFSKLSQIAEEVMGGTSGALYSLMFTTAGKVFVDKIMDINSENPKQIWARAFRMGLNGIMKYSKAQLGDKTMLDVLKPACAAFENNLSESYENIARQVLKVAKERCEATKCMMPKSGRASYVKQQKYLNNVDAGAFGVVTWIEAISQTIINSA